MTNLKKENVKKCFSLLREYLDETSGNERKGGAILALDQLQEITAGVDSGRFSDTGGSTGNYACIGKPLVPVSLK
ncbi:MAG: hypothetical protein KAW12_29575 [Candidatus Aminicenantes bacterium]|nr:hypothetical protein [Candidatus Aminicenantes bacterium]